MVGARGVLGEDRPNWTASCSRVAGCAPVAAMRHYRFRQVVPISEFRCLSRWAFGEAGRAQGGGPRPGREVRCGGLALD